MPGILEMLLKVKEEIVFLKEYLTEICLYFPARLKFLLEHLSLLTRPLLDSLSSTYELIDTGQRTLEHWLGALSPYPEILEPILSPILPNLINSLYKVLALPKVYFNAFKLLAKFGGKSRLFMHDKEIYTKH